MENHLDPDLTFPTGYIANRNLVILVAEQDAYIQSRPHSILFFYQGGKWNKMLIDFPVVSVCQLASDQPTLISLGVDGRVHLAGRTGVSVEKIDESTEGPEFVGMLTQIRVINSVPYVVGMGRQVYKRLGSGNWVRIDQGTRQPIEDEDIRGFNSIHGLDERDIYAVGYSGEIWHFDGAVWRNMPSPTNLTLNAVLCASREEVYIVGQCGTVLRGSGTRWQVIAQGATEEHFWGCEIFNGEVYLSTNTSVYVLRDGFLKEEDIGLRANGAAGKLHANDGVIWSFGSKYLSYKSEAEWLSVYVPRV